MSNSIKRIRFFSVCFDFSDIPLTNYKASLLSHLHDDLNKLLFNCYLPTSPFVNFKRLLQLGGVPCGGIVKRSRPFY
jgi:hypothetical protein